MRLRALITLAAAVATASCTPDWARDNNSEVLLLVDSVVGEDGTQLFSDVRNPGVINDNAEVSLRVVVKNPNVLPDVNGIGFVNDVRLRRYTVVYYRSDGRNTQGVDVPHQISAEISGHIPANGTLIIPVIVVRHQAKLEPPLRNLAGSRTSDGTITGIGGQQVITVFAEVTMYGETTSKRTVKGTGHLEIVFGDFPDE